MRRAGRLSTVEPWKGPKTALEGFGGGKVPEGQAARPMGFLVPLAGEFKHPRGGIIPAEIARICGWPKLSTHVLRRYR